MSFLKKIPKLVWIIVIGLLVWLVVNFAILQDHAKAQTVCMPRAQFIAFLAEKYGEEPVARGLLASGMVMEMTAAAQRGSWTILFVRPDGIACGMASGDVWTAAPSTGAFRSPSGAPAAPAL